MSQQLPVRIEMLPDQTAAVEYAHVYSGSVLQIVVDPWTCANYLVTALMSHAGWPEGISADEKNTAINTMIGDAALQQNACLFPDAGPERPPEGYQVKRNIEEWVIINPEGDLIGNWSTKQRAICVAWDKAFISGTDRPKPFYAYFGIKVEVPEGYEVFVPESYDVRMHDGHLVWEFMVTSEGNAHLRDAESSARFDNEIEARIAAWRHKLRQAPAALPRACTYQALQAGLNDIIEGGRLTRADIPDDYDWLVTSLAGLPNEPDYKSACDAIHSLVDGREWDSESTCELIDALVSAGYIVREPGEEHE